MANGKICISCYCIIPNASLQCYHCGELQLNFYNKEDRKKEKQEKLDHAPK